MKKIKVGVFDSGVGGITVLTELRKRLGFLDYVYLGDTAHVPYGTKSPVQIEKLSLDCVTRLKDQKVEALVVACNTSCAWALGAIEKVMSPIPVFGVVSPGVEAALGALNELNHRVSVGHFSSSLSEQVQRPILVLATRATVMSQAYGKILRKILNPDGHQGESRVPVIEQACPLLVPMIEEGWVDHPILHQTLLEYVKPYVEQYPPGVALLGCTHYPWIHSAFERALPGWVVVNSAQAIADSLESSELMVQYLGQYLGAGVSEQLGHVDWIFTDPNALPGFAQNWIRSNTAVQF
jgi:glutamate racemase